MAQRTHVTVPCGDVAAKLALPDRGEIPAGVFTVKRPQQAPGWEKGERTPAMPLRRAQLLYERGIIVPAETKGKKSNGIPNIKTGR